MQSLTIYRHLFSFALLLSIVISCKQASPDNVTPIDSTCQAQAINKTSVESGSTFTSNDAFSYDVKGQLTSVVTSSSSTLGGGDRTSKAYVYDNDGYQVAYKLLYSTSGQGDETISATYEYTNGGLTKETSQQTSDYYQSTGTKTYAYDAAGALTQTISAYNGKFGTTTIISSYTTTFANGIVTASKGLVNGKETTTAFIIENGRITLETKNDGSKKRYTYDAGGYQIKSEEIDATGKVTTSTTMEYGSTAAPTDVYPAQKGQPVYQPYYGNSDRVVTRITTTRGGKLWDDYTYQYQLNSKGYPSKLVRTNLITNTTQTTTYAYANCQ